MSLNIFKDDRSFTILNPLFDLGFDEDSPVDQAVNDVLNEGFGQVSDKTKSHIFATFTNSLMKHKGDGNDIKNFLSTPSTRKAWQLANITGVSLTDDIFSDDYYLDFTDENPDIKISDDIFSPPITERASKKFQKLSEILTKDFDLLTRGEKELAEAANDVGFRFKSAFDKKTGTMYIMFPPLGSDALESLMVGEMGSRNLYSQAEYKFRKNGGLVAEPLYEIYSAHRPMIQELMQTSGAKNIYFAGHSLGGGIAHLASNDELWDGFHVQTTTFGAPAVGDSDFVKNFRKDIDINRVVHSSDGVATVGTLFHPTQDVWDIAPKGENMIGGLLPVIGNKWKNLLKKIDGFLGLEDLDRGALTLDDMIDATHRADGIDNAIDSIVNGFTDLSDRKVGGFVSYPRFRAFSDLVSKKTFGNIATASIIAKSLLEQTRFKVLDNIDLFKESKLVEALKIGKKNLIKAGLVIGDGAIKLKPNQFTDKFNFDKSFFSKIAKEEKYFQELNNLPDDLYAKASLFDEFGNVLDEFVDPLVDLDDVVFKHEEIQVSERLDYGQIRRDLLAFGHDPLATIKPKKYVPIKKIVKKATDTISDEFKATVKSKLDIARGKLDDIFKVEQYTNLQVPGEVTSRGILSDIKPTILNGKLKGIAIDLNKGLKQQTSALFGGIHSKTGIANIASFKKIGILSEGAIKSGREFLQNLMKKSGKFAVKGLKFSKKLAQYVAKEVPVISAGLEIGFTVAEISGDLERIEDEKAHIVWNGEIVFKLYNPEEYQELMMLNMIYESQDLDVSFDDFVNTWYGRLSSDENGVLMIDGIRTDDPNFDVVYQKSILDVKDQSDYSGESKTLSVIKNVGLGVFNLALDISSFIAPSAGVVGSVAVGVVDEVFEQQAINHRENGFKRALKFKILNDSFRDYVDKIMRLDGREGRLVDIGSDTARAIFLEYFKWSYLKGSKGGSVGEFDEEEANMRMKKIRDRLERNGYDVGILDNGENHFNDVGEMYDREPDMFRDIATSILGLPMIGGAALGSLILQQTSMIAGLSPDLNRVDRILKGINDGVTVINTYLKMINKYYHRDRGQAAKGVKKTFYDEAFKTRLLEIVNGRRDQIDKLREMEENGDITSDDFQVLNAQINSNALFDMKLLDVSVNRNSEYRNDKEIVEVFDKFKSNQLQEAMLKNKEINKSLDVLLEKHSGVGDTRDLRKEMRLDIAKSHVDYILSISGNKGNEELRKFLLDHYISSTDPNSVAISITDFGYQHLEKFGITKKDVDMLIEGENGDDVSLSIENNIREQYLFITKIIDVFHDERSVYRDDPDVVEYYAKEGINIDRGEREEERLQGLRDQFEEQGKKYEEALQNITTNLTDQMRDREASIIEQYEARFKEVLGGLEDLGEFDISRTETRDQDQNVVDFNLKVQEGKIKLQQGRTKDKEQPGLQMDTNEVLEEQDQFDMGFADEEGNKAKFTPSGKIIPFTIRNGIPTMLFEDGSEKSYNGPKNALVGNINSGYWIGPVPKGDRAPINTIDNFYMAFHIEHQEDPLIARLRFMSRITEALNRKSIAVDVDLVEYNIAIATYNFLQENNDIYGMDMDTVLMNDGLGAELNMQMHEVTNDVRKGVLPDGVDVGDISVEDDVVNPLKRAADIAFQLGDEMMGTKFRKISVERDDMERVANEYLDSVRKASTGGKNINPLQRLVLEEFVKQDSLKDQYTRLLIESLGKNLFEFL